MVRTQVSENEGKIIVFTEQPATAWGLQTLRWKKCIGSRSNFDFSPAFLFERNWHLTQVLVAKGSGENEILFWDKTWAVSFQQMSCIKLLYSWDLGNLRLFFTIGWVVNSLYGPHAKQLPNDLSKIPIELFITGSMFPASHFGHLPPTFRPPIIALFHNKNGHKNPSNK